MSNGLISEYIPQDNAAAEAVSLAPAGTTVVHEDFPLDVTDNAVSMIKAALVETAGEDGELLRVGVKGGGCSGLSYSLNFVDDVSEDDYLVNFEDVKVIIDGFSATFLDGTTLDYVETLQGAGFKFENPNAKRTCGCGESFSI